MPTHLSLAEQQTLAARHDAFEFAHDMDGLMKTVHPNPCWIFEPFGCDITTFAAVQEMYRRLFPYLETIKHSRMLNVWFADDSVIAEVQVVVLLPDGRDGEFSLFAWFVFNGDLISGEGCYVDAEHGELLSQILGTSFFADPAVTRT